MPVAPIKTIPKECSAFLFTNKGTTNKVYRREEYLKKPNLSFLGICPQLSLQVMMGVGTPAPWQVNVTVDPRAASTDSSGGLTTVGGAAKSQNHSS